ncbi:MAG: DUF4974 domain-containing protein [Muribaculaceae bacterium]|nr:DUF4974 domain-containing protein [Muribaculaceae bacterium]
MDKYELVLAIIEHPERYSEEQLVEILSDSECREIYNLLCKTDSAVEAHKEVDVEAEWKRFAALHGQRQRPRLRWFSGRAASIAAIIGTSIVALASGIAVTVKMIEPASEQEQKPEPPTVAAAQTIPAVGSVSVPTHTIVEFNGPVMFEDETLESIMHHVALIYSVEVKFNNEDAAALHLYYRLDPTLSLDEVVAQLNTFEQISISREGNTLIID